jgi:hypothetical protein
MTRESLIPDTGAFVRGFALVAVAATMLVAQRGGLQPQPPGPSVAGHWAGEIKMVLSASKREVTLPVEFVLEQDTNNVTGKLIMSKGNRAIPVKGIEENGKLNLLWDFNEAEHCRLHLTLDGNSLNGPLFNFHDNPQQWDVDESGEVTLNRTK